MVDSNSSIFSIVTVGHVDHGKSTVVGHLLAKLGSLPEGKEAQIRQRCELQGRPFEYAFILDSLREEQKQGITIDTTRTFFRTSRRSYQLLDAPGHVEFIRNMVTGAARAEAAILMLDAVDGIQDNTRRHLQILSFLGIQQVLVVVNKMDKIGFQQDRFEELSWQVQELATSRLIPHLRFIPVSGLNGDNLISPSENLKWWQGPTLVTAMDELQRSEQQGLSAFQMFVQDVYKFESAGAEARVAVGRILAGHLKVGDRVRLWPSRQETAVQELRAANEPVSEARGAGQNVEIVLRDSLLLQRGFFLAAPELNLQTSRTWKSDVFWLGRKPLAVGRQYLFRQGSFQTEVSVVQIHHRLDAARLERTEDPGEMHSHQFGEVTFRAAQEISAQPSSLIPDLQRFVLVEDFDIVGGGQLREIGKEAPAAQVASESRLKRFSSHAGTHEGYRPHVHFISGFGPSFQEELLTAFTSELQAREVPHLTVDRKTAGPDLSVILKTARLAGAVCLVIGEAESVDPQMPVFLWNPETISAADGALLLAQKMIQRLIEAHCLKAVHWQ